MDSKGHEPMSIPPPLLGAFPPEPDLLLDSTRRLIDDAMLMDIAAADYGLDADVHLARLRLIRETGIVPAPMESHPGEVLELIRWSDPEVAAGQPSSAYLRGHQTRAFACAVLLRASAEAANQNTTIDNEVSLAPCLDSARVLGDEIGVAAARFLTWRLPGMKVGIERLFFILGILMLAVRLRTHAIENRILGILAEWMLSEETSLATAINLTNPPGFAVGNLFSHSFSVQAGSWQPLATELIHNAATIDDNDVRQTLEFIGAIVLDAQTKERKEDAARKDMLS